MPQKSPNATLSWGTTRSRDRTAHTLTAARPCRHIRDFLNSKRTQELLGVDSSMMRGNFSWHSTDVEEAFRANLDHFGFPAQYYIGALLERGVRVLIYVGATDFICNWVR